MKNKTKQSKKNKQENRFEIISDETISPLRGASVVQDKLTGTQYLYITTYANGGGLTPLLDKDGKPIIAKPKEELDN